MREQVYETEGMSVGKLGREYYCIYTIEEWIEISLNRYV